MKIIDEKGQSCEVAKMKRGKVAQGVLTRAEVEKGPSDWKPE